MNSRKILCIAAGILSICICVFTVYIFRDAGFPVLILNLAILACLLLIAGSAALWGFRRIASLRTALNQAGEILESSPEVFRPETNTGDRSPFSHAFLDACYSRYCSAILQNPESSCDLEDFLNQKVLDTYTSRSLLKSVSPVLMGTGILGGLVSLCLNLSPIGASNFPAADSPYGFLAYALVPCICGLAVFLSYAFSLSSCCEDLEGSLELFLNTHSLSVRPSYKTDSLNRLLSVYRSREEMTQDLTEIFVAQMGKSFEQAVTPAIEKMEETIRQITDTFYSSQETLMTKSCETVIRHMRQELISDFARIDKMLNSLSKAQSSYSESMARTLGRLEKVAGALEKNIENADAFHAQSLRDLNAAQRETVRAEEVQKEAYQEYIRFMYESIQRFSQIWEKYTEEFQRCADEISRMTPVRASREEKERLAKISSLLHDLQNQQIAANHAAVSSADLMEQKALLNETISRLDELTDLVQKPFFFLGHRKNREEE